MSECVVRMKMPQHCGECNLYVDGWCYALTPDSPQEKEWYASHKERPPMCPIICKLPEGHGRLVDADTIIEVMKKCAANPENAQALLCYRYAQRILEEAPTVEPASPWHRVEEEPKEPGKQYVVWASKGYAYCDKWIGDRWLISSVAPETVTHWMPIEPPKEEE